MQQKTYSTDEYNEIIKKLKHGEEITHDEKTAIEMLVKDAVREIDTLLKVNP